MSKHRGLAIEKSLRMAHLMRAAVTGGVCDIAQFAVTRLSPSSAIRSADR